MTTLIKTCRYGNIVNYTTCLGPWWDPEYFTLTVILVRR